MVTFASAVEAFQTAIVMQRSVNDSGMGIVVRIGINSVEATAAVCLGEGSRKSELP